MKLSLKALITTVALSSTLTGCILTSYSQATFDVKELRTPTWHLTSIDGNALTLTDGQQVPSLHIDEKSMATGFAGCNNFFGEAQIDANKLRITKINSTMKLCENDATELEKKVTTALQTWGTVTIDKNELTLSNEEHMLKFTAETK